MYKYEFRGPYTLPHCSKATPMGPREFWSVRLQITRHSVHEGGHLYAPAALTPRNILVLIFRGWVDPKAHGNVSCHRINSKRHRL